MLVNNITSMTFWRRKKYYRIDLIGFARSYPVYYSQASKKRQKKAIFMQINKTKGRHYILCNRVNRIRFQVASFYFIHAQNEIKWIFSSWQWNASFPYPLNSWCALVKFVLYLVSCDMHRTCATKKKQPCIVWELQYWRSRVLLLVLSGRICQWYWPCLLVKITVT